MTIERCGKCTNCKQLEQVRRRVLACVNPPFSHADDAVVEVWNEELERWGCLKLAKIAEIKARLAAANLENALIIARMGREVAVCETVSLGSPDPDDCPEPPCHEPLAILWSRNQTTEIPQALLNVGGSICSCSNRH